MKCRAKLTVAVRDLEAADTLLQFKAQGDIRAEVEAFKETELELVIRKFHSKRSLDSNNYAWLLMDKIAKAVKSTKEEVYMHLLEKYGTFFYLPCEQDKIKDIEAVFRLVRDRGIIVLKTESGSLVTCHQLQCYKGSSLMDQAEMSQFLDGVVDEAKQLGIETETPEALARMKATWEASGYKP